MAIAVFMDRDGTISKEVGYIRDPSDLRILPGAVDAVRLINESGMKAVLVTNQSGVARGHFSEEQLQKVHSKLKALLAERGAYLDGIYYCPHHPEFGGSKHGSKCNCRKPDPGMLEMAAGDLHINLADSYVVGDKNSDVELGHRVGAKGILVLTGYGKNEAASLHKESKARPHYIAENILSAVNWILRDLRENNKWKS